MIKPIVLNEVKSARSGFLYFELLRLDYATIEPLANLRAGTITWRIQPITPILHFGKKNNSQGASPFGYRAALSAESSWHR